MDAAPSTMPKTSASPGLITAFAAEAASGRREVRRITASMSRSMKQFSVFALPAASAPPASVAAISHTGGTPRWASSIVGSVVISSSSMIRGLVSANSDLATRRAVRR